ncbi:glycosyltransferase family 4 protein [Candidatus Woesearchaeota archaeon]|nr:glycosyltransferase family 4 protein [Candidatus Woesearchaeota archaeon]
MKKKKILYVPNDPLEVYYKFKQTYNMYPFKYFDPLDFFDRIFISYRSTLKSKKWSKAKFVLQRIHRTGFFRNEFFNYLNLFDYWKFIRHTVRLAKENDVDIIRSYNVHVEGFLACRVGKIVGVPVVLSIHNDFISERENKSPSLQQFIINIISRILEYSNLRAADKIFCVSTHLKNQLVRCKKIPSEKIEVLFNKVDIRKFKKVDTLEQKKIIKKYNLKEKKVFLFIGRFSWEKNIPTLLKAFKKVQVKDKNAVLLMVSGGGGKEEIASFIKKNKMSENVRLLGFVSNDELPSLFKISDCFVLPSLHEGFGIVLIEAQAAGCPIIVSDIQGVKDIVNNKNAWMFNPNKVDELENRMLGFYDSNNAVLIKNKVKNGLKDVQRFNWDRLAGIEIENYKKLMKEGK